MIFTSFPYRITRKKHYRFLLCGWKWLEKHHPGERGKAQEGTRFHRWGVCGSPICFSRSVMGKLSAASGFEWHHEWLLLNSSPSPLGRAASWHAWEVQLCIVGFLPQRLFVWHCCFLLFPGISVIVNLHLGMVEKSDNATPNSVILLGIFKGILSATAQAANSVLVHLTQ